MKNFLITIIGGLLCAGFLLSAAEPVPGVASEYEKTLLIENFDDGNISAAPEWWKFDRLETTIAAAKDRRRGQAYLQLTGQAGNYYVGGLGAYVGKSAAEYNALALDIYGAGSNSGTLRVQLFDDDNSTYQVEQDKNFKPTHDDQLEYEIVVDWEGWRTVEIPFSRFVDVNPGIGNDRWDAGATGGSGGLLHIQIIALSNAPTGKLNIGLDNLQLVKTAK
jgi:hypothetical protein